MKILKNKKLITLICSAMSLMLVLSLGFVVYSQTTKPKTIFGNADWGITYSSFDELVNGSDVIGVVKTTGKVTTEKSGSGYTSYYEVEVINPLYGCDECELLTLSMIGIKNNEIHMELRDNPLPNKNDTYLIFASKWENGNISCLNGMQGRYDYSNEKFSTLKLHPQIEKQEDNLRSMLEEQPDKFSSIEDVINYIKEINELCYVKNKPISDIEALIKEIKQ